MKKLRFQLITTTALALLAIGSSQGIAAASESLRLSQANQAPNPLQERLEDARRKAEEARKAAEEKRRNAGQGAQQQGRGQQGPAERQPERRNAVPQQQTREAPAQQQRRQVEPQPQIQRQERPAARQEQPARQQERRQEQTREREAAPPQRERQGEQPRAPQRAEQPARERDATPPAQEQRRQGERPQEPRQEQTRERETAPPQGEQPRAPQRVERPERPDRAGTPQRPERPERTERTQRPERPDRPGTGEARRENPLPPNAAPVLDSAKETERLQRERPRDRAGDDRDRRGPNAQPDRRREARPDQPPPQSDRAAQRHAPREIQPLPREEGRRIDRRPGYHRDDRGTELVGKFGDRVVIRFSDGRIGVEEQGRDRPRWASRGRDYYVEELPGGLTREVVEQRDGTRIVTIRNRYGDIVRRSRFAPGGREIVLVYAPDIQYHDGRWEDPGLYLPPLTLGVPVAEYILDGRQANTQDYYRFLDKPPVETIDRFYSIDEVRRSARLRDVMPRIDLDMITFEFGSAAIDQSQVPMLEELADAILDLLEENPAETFLIEGHTDAVGSEYANLALSDSRAEEVANALTEVFGIPPENLVTQGYGESYLKVDTQAPERANRRVAIRRITPLVTPLAEAQ